MHSLTKAPIGSKVLILISGLAERRLHVRTPEQRLVAHGRLRLRLPDAAAHSDRTTLCCDAGHGQARETGRRPAIRTSVSLLKDQMSASLLAGASP